MCTPKDQIIWPEIPLGKKPTTVFQNSKENVYSVLMKKRLLKQETHANWATKAFFLLMWLIVLIIAYNISTARPHLLLPTSLKAFDRKLGNKSVNILLSSSISKIYMLILKA